jgi:hypothetical protein
MCLGSGLPALTAPFLLARTLLAAGCANPAVHRDVSIDSLPPSVTSQPDERHVPVGQWEYVDDGVTRLTFDDLGNGHYV